MKVYRPTNWDDVYFVSDNMREEDQDECRAGGLTPFDALSLSFDQSDASFTLISPDGIPAAILGVSPGHYGDHMGCVWMLGTDDIRKHKVHFLKHCRDGLQDLFDTTGKEGFYNYSYADNALHHSWLRWLGFVFLRPVNLPPYDNRFYEFVRLKG